MASMEFKYTRIKWRLEGTHVMSFGKKAKWLRTGCEPGCELVANLVANWLHSSRGVDSSRLD